MGDPRQYVVIGGGLAGLASAVWLAEAGKKVTLLERRGRPGGRAHTTEREAGHGPPGLGQHLIARRAEAGKKVTLPERRGRLGGRAHAMKVDAVDDPPDNGQHVIASGYENLFRYLDSVGTREHVAFPERSTLRWPDGRSVTMSVTGLGAIRTLTGLHPDTGLLDRLRTLRATGLLLWQALNQPHDLADLTTAQWFERIGMPARSREALSDWLALEIGR